MPLKPQDSGFSEQVQEAVAQPNLVQIPLLTPCNIFAKTDSEAPEPLNTTFNLVSQVYIK